MKKVFKAACFALFATVGWSGMSQAATVSATCTSNNTTTYTLTNALSAHCSSGNDKNTITTSSVLFGLTGWTLSDASDDNAGSHVINFAGANNSAGIPGPNPTARSGAWSLDSFGGYPNVFISLKAGNTFAAFLLDMTAGLTGSWTTSRNLSHASVYVRGGPTVVPLPATALLLIGAMGGLAAMRRRKSI